MIEGVYNEHCLDTMRRMQDKSIDLVLTDPPYGITANQWDVEVDFMAEALRVSNVVVLTSAQPFSSKLISEHLRYFRYEWIWEKTRATGHLNAQRMPLRAHENILVFSSGKVKYHPQKITGHTPVHGYTKHQEDGSNYGKTKSGISGGGSTERYPRSVLLFPPEKRTLDMHPTQKPQQLFEYLLRTYSDPGDTVYDPFMGSGTTAVACQSLGRKFIGSETVEKYCALARQRLTKEKILVKEDA